MKKSFLRILTVTLTLLLVAGTVMMPISAAVPEEGTSVSSNSGSNTNSLQTIKFRPADALNATNPWISSDESVWKFAVGALGDTFKPTSADFAAPTATAVAGAGIKLSWEAPTDGAAIVKVIADDYNKEIVTKASSITLCDTKIGKTYQVQVTVDGVSSEILSYNNIYSPITTKNLAGNDDQYITVDRYDSNGNITNQWSWTAFVLKDYVDLIGENTGFIFRVESVYDEENLFNIIKYIDQNNKTNTKDTLLDMTEDQYISSKDSGIAFNAYIGSTEIINEGSTKAFESNADTKRTVYRIDTTGMGVNTSVKVANITNGSNMKGNFRSGYIIVPFDILGESGIDFIKENGKFSLTTEAFRYYPKHTWFTTYAGGSGWASVDALNYLYTDIADKNTIESTMNVMLDREIFLGDAGFISDIDAFIATCVDTNVATANVDFSKLGNASETKGTVYLNTLTDTTVTSDSNTLAAAVILSDSKAVSTYTASAYENVTYTTAAGEKMMLGFTAPITGVYDLACPITVADYATKGVYTRVVKESADGTKTIIQPEAAYNGEKHLALITENLTAGETVWFEAWANTASTVLDLGMPQMTNLALYTDKNQKKNYSWYAYYDKGIHSSDKNIIDVNGTLSFGYFINGFEVDGTEYDYILKDTFDNATSVKYDTLGIANMSVTDDETTDIDETDATELLNSLKRHEKGRGGVLKSVYDCYRYKNGTSFGVESNATNGWQSSGFAVTGTRQVRVSYGFTTAFGGSLKSVYYDAGVYLQFTAPSDGVIGGLAAGDSTQIVGKGVVLHNNKVIATSTGAYNELNVSNLEVKKGDTVTICYATTDGTNTFYTNEKGAEYKYRDIYDPRLTFTPAETTEKTVTFNEKTDNLMPTLYAEGAKITLPRIAKAGAIFDGWNDGTATYAAGSEYTVSADTAFTAQYSYYGDLDGIDGVAQAADITVMRKMIIGAENTGASEKATLTGDIDANGAVNLTDLVKIKKMSVGADVTVGAK